MVYITLKNWTIKYSWNKINQEKIIDFKNMEEKLLQDRVYRVKNEKIFFHLANIDNWVFFATIEYFKGLRVKWFNLPLTTLMISSPWEIYAWQRLNYTTDTLPIEILNWFGSEKRIFLSESSQFYLELWLLINNLNQVFSIYNSFRKEESDATHLSEFQHIEYEWKVDLEQNIKVFMWLFEHIFDYLLVNNKNDLLCFLTETELNKKIDLVKKWPIKIWFREALNLLYKETWDEKYKEFSLKNFWIWEEIKLTEILWWNVIIEKFPMLQIPFYHAIAKEEIDWVPIAKNVDFILYWYRETIWAWERIKDKEVLLEKAKIFNLPEIDYLPYLKTRDFNDYEITSWFGMWWQRLVQWLTNQPYIYESTIFPRTHLIPNP
jgi:aspartyl/asparaginyl-tRNA synthetase